MWFFVVECEDFFGGVWKLKMASEVENDGVMYFL